jgi:type IV pilus assembly protein PilY1
VNNGQWQGRALAWRSGTRQWVALSGSSRSRPMECQNDVDASGNPHGQATGDGRPFPVTGTNGPWHTAATATPTWTTNYTLYNGNWLNYFSSGGTVIKSRIQMVREVTNNLLQDLDGVNVGLVHFNNTEGGTVAQAISNIATSRGQMQAAVSALNASTWTPLSETLYEVANYYMGRPVDYGNVGPVLSAPASRVGNVAGGANYQKPATYACQKNYVIILTDGLPTQDQGASGKIRALPDWAANVTDPTCSGTPGGHGECMSDLAEYLYRHDLNSSLAGLQNVTTYTIGFGVDLALGDTSFLQETARKGGGQYYPALDTGTLQQALTAIVFDILEDATTFSTPTAPVNAFNRTQNLSDVFVSVFAPAITAHWPGNLKKYRLSGGQLLDATGAAAVDEETGFFSSTSRSYWSDDVDGDSAQLGGAANELPEYTGRELHTDISGTDLSASGNAVAVANGGLTASLLGVATDARDDIINWARGLDLRDEDDDGENNDIRHVMGDPLHVRPVMLVYGGTESSPDATVFVSTNDGYLHAVNPADGSERWAYVPREMLGRLGALYENDTASNRSYGLDGEITLHILKNDGIPGISGEERAILYFGMRRGGQTLYAVEVTERDNPVLLWKINSTTAGYGALGQTWSPPVITKVNVNGTVRNVAIFGGGYNPGQDAPGYLEDSQGNAIYMADALTGALIWSVGDGGDHDLDLGDMTNAIPSGIRVLDVNQDKLADRMYAGDMGGRVWRFDILNGEPVDQLVQGGVFASLGAADLTSPTLPDTRRFYATPDVARIISGHRVYLSINVGSGHRENPLDTATADEFYGLRDYDVFTVLGNEAYDDPITREDLVDITDVPEDELPYDTKGWRLRLDMSPGEKIVSESRTFDNTVFFTSFTPGGNGDACVAAGGLNRLYAVSVRDGAPLANLDGSEDDDALTAEDRIRELNQGGMAPDPAFFFSPPDGEDDPAPEACLSEDGCPESGDDDDGTEITLCLGVECFDPGIANPPVRTRWNQAGAD